MKKLVYLTILVLAFSINVFAQKDMAEKKKATEADKVATFDEEGKIKRGAPIGDSKKVSLKKVMKNPEKYAGKMVRVKGYVVRSCKKEGCCSNQVKEQRSEGANKQMSKGANEQMSEQQ